MSVQDKGSRKRPREKEITNEGTPSDDNIAVPVSSAKLPKTVESPEKVIIVYPAVYINMTWYL